MIEGRSGLLSKILSGGDLPRVWLPACGREEKTPGGHVLISASSCTDLRFEEGGSPEAQGQSSQGQCWDWPGDEGEGAWHWLASPARGGGADGSHGRFPSQLRARVSGAPGSPPVHAHLALMPRAEAERVPQRGQTQCAGPCRRG